MTVEFVDYGNEEVVEKSKLRKKLDHHLFNLPFQVTAVQCLMYMYGDVRCTYKFKQVPFQPEVQQCR